MASPKQQQSQYQEEQEQLQLEFLQANPNIEHREELVKEDNDEEEEEQISAGNTENIGSSSSEDLQPRRRKRNNHRHTCHQIKQMEKFFQKCSHPDDEQRRELGQSLGLDPLQVKFWFQNKRTQTKCQQERKENYMLCAENENLWKEIAIYKEALKNAFCPSCGVSANQQVSLSSIVDHQLFLENYRLKEEIYFVLEKQIKRMSALAGVSLSGKSVQSSASSPVNHGDQSRIDHPLTSAMTEEIDTPGMVELAMVAMEEFMVVAQIDLPLWLPSGLDGAMEALNEDYYLSTFEKSGFRSRLAGKNMEATRETAILLMDINELLQVFMEVNHWRAYFSGIVSRAATIEVLSNGIAGSFNGALQVMSSEYQLPTPMVPIRESTFLRYCKQHPEGTWAITDVSAYPSNYNASSSCRRRPSGCLVNELPDGYLKVRWVEHVEADISGVHDMYKTMINMGLAFGAKRWVAALLRQNERLQVVATNDSFVVYPYLLKLAERMFVSFCAGVMESAALGWVNESVTAANCVRESSRKSVDDPGTPCGMILCGSTSIWLPVLPKTIFEYLQDETSRFQWDILSNSGTIKEVARIMTGQEQGNCISLLAVSGMNPETNGAAEMMIIQEGCSDATGAYVIYAPVSYSAMSMVLQGSDPNLVPLLPSGFAVTSDGSCDSGGSLLTIAFQLLVDNNYESSVSRNSTTAIESLVYCTLDRIKAAFL